LESSVHTARNRRLILPLGIVLTILVIDQISKVIVLNTMERGESIPLLGSWLRFTFTENPGMAFGLSFGPPATITILSIVATGLIVYYLLAVARHYLPYTVSLSFVLGGALGNIIDRVFYGKILYDGPLFQGHVVDFIHVDVWRGYVSEAVPLLGGNYMALFPIWNVADMAIVVGVAGILVFQKSFHEHETARASLPGDPGSHGEDAGKERSV
jgi:signal peptidase II